MIKAAFWSSFDKIVYQALNFVIAILIARYLGPKNVGTVAIINGYVYLLNIFVDSGLSISIIRNKDITDREVSAIFLFNLAVSLLFVLLTLCCSPFLESYFHIERLSAYLNYSSVILVLNSLAFVRYARMEQQMQFRKESFINVFSMLAAGAACYYMLTLGYGIMAVVMFTIAFALLKNLLYLLLTPRFRVLKFEFAALRPHLLFGKNLLVSSTVEAIYNNGFPVLINKLFSVFQSGIFFQSKRLIDGPVQLISVSSRRLFLPSAAKLGNDMEGIFSLLLDVLRAVNFILILMVALLFINADYLITILMGSQWHEAILVMKILIFGMAFYSPYFLCIDVFKITGDSGAYSRTVFLSRLFSTLLIALSAVFGFLYLVIFFAVAQFLMFTGAVLQLRKAYGFNALAIWKTIAPFMATLVAGLFAVSFLPEWKSEIVGLLVKSAAFSFLYVFLNAVVFRYHPLKMLYKKIRP
jgi:teichuronic acid exporter